MKHAVKTYLALIVTAVVLLSNIPLSALGDIGSDEKHAAVGTASDCGQKGEEDAQETKESGENVGSASDALPGSNGKEPGDGMEDGPGNKMPEQAFKANAEGLAMMAVNVSAEEMFSFAKNTGTINGFSKAFLDGLEPGPDGYCYVDLVIPDSIDGVEVENIADGAFKAQNYKSYTSLKIRSLDLSNAVHLKTIKYMAFYNIDGNMYSEMQSCTLELPEGLLSIGPCAFQYQTALTGDLIIPNSVTDVGYSAFMGDSGFNGTLKLSSECIKISYQSFNGCKFAGTLTIPEKVTLIEGNLAFEGNQFHTIVLNNIVEEIGASAFKDCTQLKEVKVAGEADSFIHVNLPQSLKTLGNNIFNGCSKLEGSVIIPESVETVGYTIFAGTKIKTIYASGNETIVYPNHFIYNTGINALIFPSKELYDKNASSLGGNKNLCSYPITINFAEKNGNIVETRDVLYNRPIGYTKNPDTLVWAQDATYTLPSEPSASLCYDSGWAFGEGKRRISVESIVVGDTLCAPLTDWTYNVIQVTKTYDGQPSYLEMEGIHPIITLDDNYYFYYFLDTSGSFTNIVYDGSDPIHYAVTDVEDSGKYKVQIQLRRKDVSSSLRSINYILHVNIQKASTLPAPPIYNSTPVQGALLADVLITLPQNAPPGKIEWKTPSQVVSLGAETYDWIFTPDNPSNFTTDTISGTAGLIGSPAPAVTGITVTPAKAEVKKGETLQFHADIKGNNSPSQAVIWSVDGAAAEGTRINSAGLLTVDSGELADTLIVTATSAADPTFQATAAVTLINLPPEPDPVPDPDPTPEPDPEPTPDPVPDPEPATFTVTFNSLGGSTVSPITGIKSGSTITLPTVLRAGYRFDGWFSKESGGNRFTQQTPVTEDWSLYAHWTLIKDQNSNNTADDDDEEDDEPTAPKTPTPTPSANSKVEAGVREDGKAAATVTTDVVKDQIEKALQSAKQNTTAAAPVNVDIQVTSKEANPDALAVSLPLDVITQLIDSKVDNVDITIDKPDIAIRLNLACLREMKQQANSGVQIEARRINAAPFSEEVRSAAGNRPMFDLTAIAMADQKNITNFGLGEAVVSIPYELQQGENAEDMVAIYIDPSGKVEYLEQSYYDAAAKAVVFGTSHFSVYGIGKRPAAGQNGKGGSTQTYIVRRNDNLWKISNLFHCSIKELVELNNIKNPDIIITGSQLLIPQP